MDRATFRDLSKTRFGLSAADRLPTRVDGLDAAKREVRRKSDGGALRIAEDGRLRHVVVH